MENPEEFDMKELKKLLGEKPDAKHFKVEDHPKYRELLELIEDAKNGKELNLIINKVYKITDLI